MVKAPDAVGRATTALGSGFLAMLGRMGTAEEQAETIVFLASDEASYLSGVILNNDGGQLALHSGVML